MKTLDGKLYFVSPMLILIFLVNFMEITNIHHPTFYSQRFIRRDASKSLRKIKKLIWKKFFRLADTQMKWSTQLFALCELTTEKERKYDSQSDCNHIMRNDRTTAKRWTLSCQNYWISVWKPSDSHSIDQHTNEICVKTSMYDWVIVFVSMFLRNYHNR